MPYANPPAIAPSGRHLVDCDRCGLPVWEFPGPISYCAVCTAARKAEADAWNADPYNRARFRIQNLQRELTNPWSCDDLEAALGLDSCLVQEALAMPVGGVADFGSAGRPLWIERMEDFPLPEASR